MENGLDKQPNSLKFFNTIFMTEPIIATFIKTTCLPHICKRFPAAPENATTSLPLDKIINDKIPILNSSPNISIRNSEKKIKINTKGNLVKKINFVD